MWKALLAVACASIATSAAATTIVQVAGNTVPYYEPGIFQGFDYSLGTLDSVTLEITGTDNRLASPLGYWPQNAPAEVGVSWTIDGDVDFNLFEFFGAQLAGPFAVPVYGTGTATVSDDNRAIAMSATGSATFNIDPVLVPQLTDNLYDLRVGYGLSGFYTTSDEQFSSDYPLDIQGLGYECAWGQGEETCNRYTYTLTYNYTPNYTPSVPEPASWAMLIVGFGALGLGLRVRRRPRRALPAHGSRGAA